jgi:2,4-dienoyl-CoA reductase-like NADH-dependent reductase (Old Yellow Enzyme family)
MDEHSAHEPHRLTPEEVGARVGAILSDAEREAREIIAAAREGTGSGGARESTLDDLTHALERLCTRFDAFELATAAQIEELGRRLSETLANAPAVVAAEALPASQTRPRREESAAMSAARVRAIDLAVAGYAREVIANELAASLPRAEIEAMLDDILVS